MQRYLKTKEKTVNRGFKELWKMEKANVRTKNISLFFFGRILLFLLELKLFRRELPPEGRVILISVGTPPTRAYLGHVCRKRESEFNDKTALNSLPARNIFYK